MPYTIRVLRGVVSTAFCLWLGTRGSGGGGLRFKYDYGWGHWNTAKMQSPWLIGGTGNRTIFTYEGADAHVEKRRGNELGLFLFFEGILNLGEIFLR